MTQAETIFESSGFPVLLSVHGEDGTYLTSSDGLLQNIRVVVRDWSEDEMDGNRGRSAASRCRVLIPTSTDLDGVEVVSQTATLTIRGVELAIEGTPKKTGAFTEVRCVSKAMREVSRPGYREKL